MKIASRRIAARGWGLALALMIAAPLVLVPVTPANAEVKGLYYKEEVKDGRVYVFNTPERYNLWQQTGEMGTSITVIGHGPNGETVVAENETALDLYNFKHDRPAYERPTPPPPPPAAPTFPQIKIGGLWYLSYQDGSTNGADYSKFVLKRGYLNVESKLTPYLSARITPDITQDSTGDVKVRLKYLYGKFTTGSLGFVTDPMMEIGLVHMPWLDFEEHINEYRMQDTMFMERNGLFNSADFGVTFGGLFGGKVSDEYQKTVSKAYPGRYGSFMVGVYNGGGYHASEANTNKAIEGRLTIRPLPDVAPGLQFSYFGINGKGNTAAAPDWTVNAIMASFESERLVLTGQWVDATGSQNGKAVDAQGNALDGSGWSVFGEGRLTSDWSLIARYDRFDPNKDVSNDVQKRTIGGIAYHIVGSNTVLLDYERLEFEQAGRKTDDRLQLTLQVSF